MPESGLPRCSRFSCEPSDGLSAKWDVSDYPGLLAKSPQMIAGVLAPSAQS